MQTEAIILKTQPAREYDLYVHCYTRHAGRLMATAKGALREGSVQAMHLDQCNLVQFDLVPGKGAPIIAGAHALETFPNIKSDLMRLSGAWTLLEVVHGLVTGQEEDEILWNVLNDGLRGIATADRGALLGVLRDCQLHMLSALGYAPRVHECGVCGMNPSGSGTFSVQLGSILCANCAREGWHGTPLQSADVAWLSGISTRAPSAEAATRAPTEQLLEYISGRPLRSLDLLFRGVRA